MNEQSCNTRLYATLGLIVPLAHYKTQTHTVHTSTNITYIKHTDSKYTQ